MMKTQRRPSFIDLAAFAAVILVPLACLLGRWSWILDLANHFRFPLLLAVAAALVWFTIRRFPLRSLSAAAVLLLLGGSIVPYYYPWAGRHSTQTPDLKIFYANVLTSNKQHDLLIKQIKQKNPDVIALLETNKRWIAAMRQAFPEYSFVETEPREDNFGISMLSKIPAKFELLHYGPRQFPMIRAEMTVNGHAVVFWTLHPPPPKGASSSRARNSQLAEVGKILQAEKHPVLLAADLNTSPWSHALDLILTDKMEDGRKGFGLGLSWPSILPKFCRTPIDYVLHSREFEVLEYQVLEFTGSDHYPVYAGLKLKD